MNNKEYFKVFESLTKDTYKCLKLLINLCTILIVMF